VRVARQSRQGKLIVFEGPDGVGKSTLSQALAKKLTEVNILCEHLAFPGKEEGTIGRLVYDLHHNPNAFGLHKVTPASLQALHIAAHLDAI
jgi:dTMP kinase